MKDRKKEKTRFTHDSLIQKVYKDPKEISALLQENLPEKFVKKIDWSTLQYMEKFFVDEKFKRKESDLIFKAKMVDSETNLFFYFLFEHQSTPDKWMRFRLLNYKCSIWQHFIDLYRDKKVDEKGDFIVRSENIEEYAPFHDDKLPAKQTKKRRKRMPPNLLPIIPIVFYQGKRKWNYPTNFDALIKWDGIDESLIYSFSHFLIDQSDYGVERFKGELKGKVVQLLMKIVFHGLIKEEIRLLSQWMNGIEEESRENPGTDWVTFFLNYLLKNQKLAEVNTIVQTLEKEAESESIRRKVMTAYEEIQQKGELIGIKKGELIGIKKGELRGKIKLIQEMLNLPQSSEEELKSKSITGLESMLLELKSKWT